jgi:hypothetical protein
MAKACTNRFLLSAALACGLALAAGSAKALPAGPGDTYVRELAASSADLSTMDTLIVSLHATGLTGYAPALNALLDVKLFAGATQLGGTIQEVGIEIHDSVNFVLPASVYLDSPRTVVGASDFDTLRNGTYATGDLHIEMTLLNASGDLSVSDFVFGASQNLNTVEVLDRGALGEEYVIAAVASAPEPGTLAVLGLGLTGLGVIRRRRR